MKQFITVLLLVVVSIATSQAQTSNDPIELTNSLSGLWGKGKTTQAVENSMALYELRPSFFIDRIHYTLVQKIDNKRTNKHVLEYLTVLHQQENQEINNITLPIYLWSKTAHVKKASEYIDIVAELKQLVGDSSDYASKKERYCLLIVKKLRAENAISKAEAEKIVKQVITALETYPYKTLRVEDKQEACKRAWHRYMLAYSYDYLYTNFDSDEKYLKLSSDYSPDLSDKQFKHNYFYDMAVLDHDLRRAEFHNKYKEFLKANHEDVKLLDLLASISFGHPSHNNMNALSTHFSKMNPDASFNTYWAEYINSQGIPSPELKLKFKDETLDLTKAPGNWIYIDVWGTWCKPCRNELPDFQKFYDKNLTDTESKLKMYTFSYNSKELDVFMKENNYSFPVCEISKETNDAFYVKGYPTKILITPEGNYIKIPSSVNWEMFLRGYVQM